MPLFLRVTATHTTTIPTIMTTTVAMAGTSTFKSTQLGHQVGSHEIFPSRTVGAMVARMTDEKEYTMERKEKRVEEIHSMSRVLKLKR